MKKFLAGLLTLWCATASAQPVQQSGVITPGHAACWAITGVIFDCGAPGGGVSVVGSTTTNDLVAFNASGSLIDSGLNPAATSNISGLWNFNGGATAPTLATGNNTTNVATTAFVQSALALGQSFPRIALTGTASAAGFGAADQVFFAAGNYTGNGTGPYAEVSVIDTATNLTLGTALVGWRVDHSFSTNPGSRTAIQSILNINGNTGTSGGNPDGFKFYTSIFGQTYANVNDAGTNGTPRGLIYGLAGLAQMQCPVSPACFYTQITGAELDVSVQANNHVDYKSILSLINVNSDAVKGSVFDGALVFTADSSTSVRWTYLISVGRPDSTWPIDSSSTIFGAVTPAIGSMVANYGVDFSNITFSTCAFKSAGFCMASAGSLQLSGSSAGASFGSRSGSGETLQWYNNAGTGLALFNGTRDIATFDNTNDGSLTLVGPLSAGAGSVVGWTGRASISSPADGVIELSNNAKTDFIRLQFGGTTSSFPAIKRNSATLNFRLADDSADAAITAAGITASGQIISTFGATSIASGACGATTNGTVAGTNASGLITIGAATTTTCTVTFSTTITAPGACVITAANAKAGGTVPVARVSSIGTTNFVITGTDLASTTYYYVCL